MNKLKRLAVFSRHPSHRKLRAARVMLPVATSLRLGSVTRGEVKYAVELNKPEAVRISSNKLLMKRKFTEAGITTPEWWTCIGKLFLPNGSDKTHNPGINDLPYPIVAKSLHGSRGMGNHLIYTAGEMTTWLHGKDLSNYIFERFYKYSREYRLHISANGCFYTCRKMLKSDTPKDKRWYRNDSNSVWVLESNPSFNKPARWPTIVEQCVKALNVVGLDLAAFDVKVSNTPAGEFIIIESNSAPSFGELTLEKYVEEIPKIVNNKLNK